MRIFLVFLLIFCAPLARAGVEQMPEPEFRKLAAELAPKVNLFRDVWAQDPAAEFYGGTSRDFLYWLKGQFAGANDPESARVVAEKLRALPLIDVREFIIGDSDVDIVSSARPNITAADYGVRKVDYQPKDIFDPASEAGFNELNQGYAPAEKIRLGKDGLVPSTGLGDGAHELYTGKLTVHFAEPADFARTKYAKAGLNHPVLLALRYIRLRAMNFFRTFGAGFPNAKDLAQDEDAPSAAAAKRVIADATRSGELKPFLEKSKFRAWVNGAIQKAFRSYTNPTAALMLMKNFGVDLFVNAYSGPVEPINQYVFAKYRDEAKIAENYARAGVKPEEVLVDPATAFPDGFLYHGTKTEPAFRGILFQGVLPSQSGSAGGGLYGVASQHRGFAEKWGGDRSRLLKFPVPAKTKIMDITEGAGAALWKQWGRPQDFDGFAEAYGVDVLRYPYQSTEAYVVKNAGALGKASGVYREVLPLGALLDKVRGRGNLKEVTDLLAVNNLTMKEQALLLEAARVPTAELAHFVAEGIASERLPPAAQVLWFDRADAWLPENRAASEEVWKSLLEPRPAQVRTGYRLMDFHDQIPLVLQDPRSAAFPEWISEWARLRSYRATFSPTLQSKEFWRVMKLPHWADHPEREQWVKSVTKDNPAVAIQRLFSQETYRRDPRWLGWVSSALQVPRSTGRPYAALARSVLSQAEIAQSPQWAAWIDEILERFPRNNSYSQELEELAKHVLTKDFARAHERWAEWAGEVAKDPNYGKFILEQPWSTAYPELLRSAALGVDRSDHRRQALTRLLELDHWADYAPLRELCGGPPTAGCLIKAAARGELFPKAGSDPQGCDRRFAALPHPR